MMHSSHSTGTYPESVFEAIVRPSTWDGDEENVRVGLFYTVLHAAEVAEEWIAAHPYPFKKGTWETIVNEIPMGVITATMPAKQALRMR